MRCEQVAIIIFTFLCVWGGGGIVYVCKELLYIRYMFVSVCVHVCIMCIYMCMHMCICIRIGCIHKKLFLLLSLLVTRNSCVIF